MTVLLSLVPRREKNERSASGVSVIRLASKDTANAGMVSKASVIAPLVGLASSVPIPLGGRVLLGKAPAGSPLAALPVARVKGRRSMASIRADKRVSGVITLMIPLRLALAW